MKKFFLLIVCAASFVAGHAQVKYGAKGGFNLANLTGPDVNDNKMKLSFHVGAFANVPIADKFSFQPELVYSAQGAKFEDPGDDDKYKLSYLNIPLLGQYNDPSGFYAETGPQIGFLLAAKLKSDGNTSDIKDGFKTLDFAWAFGAGYKFTEKASVGVRFNLGLANVIDDNDAKVRNSVFQIGIAYTIGSFAK
jgi:Outer membrane protein beta-barrel domain